MPSMKGGKPSRKQHNLMEAVAHDPKFARKAGIPAKVGRDFVAADKAAGLFKGKPSLLTRLAGK